jgi:diguanylate cyclase (GGDEF)-like protein
MSNLAMTDTLTQVDNRRQLEKHLNEEVKRADRHRLPLAVIMFDIDNFKRINDRFGHNTGDEVLVKTAQIIKDSLRSSDHFGRWGGDEFLCVATNTNEDTANQLAERLRNELEQAKICEGIPCTGSFGVTRFTRGDTPDGLVRRADMGLFRAKNNGRNQVVTIPPETTLPI